MFSRVCTLGGGSGMPIVNRALIKAGFEDISSIVTIFDSGGDTGRMRTDERGRILAFSDYWRSLISLWDDGDQKVIWEKMLQYRDGRSRNFGNLFFQFMTERTGNISKVNDLFCSLTRAKIKGQVIPVSLKPSEMYFSTISGKSYIGEHCLDEMRMSLDLINKIWLKPKVAANPNALKAMTESEVIIISPGSMYGSVLVNFLPEGMKEAFVESKAKKILMTNIMSVANENDGYCESDYVNIFSKYLGVKSPFDVILMPDFKVFDERLLEKVYQNYAYEHSAPIKCAGSGQKNIMVADIAVIEKTNCRLRHSVTKLSKILPNLIDLL